MILSKPEIIREIRKGRIQIDPYEKKNIGPASIDLTLANEFFVYPKKRNIFLSENFRAEAYTIRKKCERMTLLPGDFILAQTKEKITLPTNICGFLSGRSRFARIGLVIDAAFLIPPGVSNHQILELKNLSKQKLTIPAGLKVAQLILCKMAGKAWYEGRYKQQ